MDFTTLAWLFAVAVTVHNVEEAIWLPGWSASAGRFHVPVSAGAFRFAVVVLTLAAWIIVAWFAMTGSRLSGYLVSGFALAMLVNVIFPHLAATLAMRRYAPGTATAVLLNLPVTAMLLRTAFAEGRIERATFMWAGPLTAVVIAASIPLLFGAGRLVTASWRP